MYAIFENSGKQYRVYEGQVLRIGKLNNEINENIDLDKVIMIVNNEKVKIGSPYIKNSKITVKILFHGKEKKISIIKFRRRKHYRKFQGHRQNFTTIKIINIK